MWFCDIPTHDIRDKLLVPAPFKWGLQFAPNAGFRRFGKCCCQPTAQTVSLCPNVSLVATACDVVRTVSHIQSSYVLESIFTFWFNILGGFMCLPILGGRSFVLRPCSSTKGIWWIIRWKAWGIRPAKAVVLGKTRVWWKNHLIMQWKRKMMIPPTMSINHLGGKKHDDDHGDDPSASDSGIPQDLKPKAGIKRPAAAKTSSRKKPASAKENKARGWLEHVSQIIGCNHHQISVLWFRCHTSLS